MIDYSTDLGKVRGLIPDTDETALILPDEQILMLLTLEGGIKKATAQALETIASNEALVGKVIKTQDLTTDGAKVAAELRARAAELRRQADEDDPQTGGGFDIVDFHDPWHRRTGELTEWEIC